MAKKKVQKTVWNREKPKKKRPFLSFSTYLVLVGLGCCVIYVICRENLLASDVTATTAVIQTRTRHISHGKRYYRYNYIFYAKGETYSGRTSDTCTYNRGDIITVKYVPGFPHFNQIVESAQALPSNNQP